MANKKPLTKPKYNFGDILLIEWDDAQCYTSGEGCYKEDAFDIKTALCNTVGFFVERDDSCVKIAFKISDDGHLRHVVAIPNGCINIIKKLGKYKNARERK